MICIFPSQLVYSQSFHPRPWTLRKQLGAKLWSGCDSWKVEMSQSNVEGLCLSLLSTFLYLPPSFSFLCPHLPSSGTWRGGAICRPLFWPGEGCSAHRSPSELGAGLLLACGEKATPAEGLLGLGGGWTNLTTERPVFRLFRPCTRSPGAEYDLSDPRCGDRRHPAAWAGERDIPSYRISGPQCFLQPF